MNDSSIDKLISKVSAAAPFGLEAVPLSRGDAMTAIPHSALQD